MKGWMGTAPFTFDAPADTVDGWVRANVDEWEWWAASDLLPVIRRQAKDALRSTLPTGVTKRKGQTALQAIREALSAGRDEVDCPLCGVGPAIHPEYAHVDHGVPLSQGGRHHINNLALVHPWCNDIKRANVGLSRADIQRALLKRLEAKGNATSWMATELRQRLDGGTETIPT